MMHWDIDADIRKARTLPADFYRQRPLFAQLNEGVFRPSWQVIDPALVSNADNHTLPFIFLPNCCDEAMVLVKANGALRCLSNVCTHRAMLIVTEAQSKSQLRCPYHGRCFDLQGRFKSMPEFESAVDFPSASDHLRDFPVRALGPLKFTSLTNEKDFDQLFEPVIERLRWLPFDRLSYRADLSKTYDIAANWILYCDNYLEGFHVPYVHEALNTKIVYDTYETLLFDEVSIQIGFCKPGQQALPIDAANPDYGRDVFAYYMFVFPNLMLNVYNWGISVNVVQPAAVDRTIVRFDTYLFDDATPDQFHSTAIHQTELEDEWIVERVQKGIRAQSYSQGRYSPKMERAVHHFHQLIISHYSPENGPYSTRYD